MGGGAGSVPFPLFPHPNKEHNPVLPNSEDSDSLTPKPSEKNGP
jgi:hypothetical protein